MPYTTCCRARNPMAPSRIAHDLKDSGFDPNIQLSIAQESLRHLNESVRGLPEIEKEYQKAILSLKDVPGGLVKERMGKLAENMKDLHEELKGAPGKIEELKSDIAMLKECINTKGDQEGSKPWVTANGKGNGAEKSEVEGKEGLINGHNLSEKVEGLKV
ncbi:MAG: hypothetical protein Q9170_007855 [Blastenia crenularia]